MDADEDLGNHLKDYLTEQESTFQPSGTNASSAIHLEDAQPEIEKSLVNSVWQERRESLDTDEDRHVRLHDDVKPDVCPYCEKEFREKRSLDKHIRAILKA